MFTSNIFAILGLRSLYFLLAAVVDRFHLLKYGLARDPDVRRREDARRELLSTSTSCCRSRSSSGAGAIDRRVDDLAKKRTCGARHNTMSDAAQAAPLSHLASFRSRRGRRAGSRSTAVRGDRRSRASPSARRRRVCLGALERFAVHLVEVGQNAFAGA